MLKRLNPIVTRGLHLRQGLSSHVQSMHGRQTRKRHRQTPRHVLTARNHRKAAESGGRQQPRPVSVRNRGNKWRPSAMSWADMMEEGSPVAPPLFKGLTDRGDFETGQEADADLSLTHGPETAAVQSAERVLINFTAFNTRHVNYVTESCKHPLK